MKHGEIATNIEWKIYRFHNSENKKEIPIIGKIGKKVFLLKTKPKKKCLMIKKCLSIGRFWFSIVFEWESFIAIKQAQFVLPQNFKKCFLKIGRKCGEKISKGKKKQLLWAIEKKGILNRNNTKLFNMNELGLKPVFWIYTFVCLFNFLGRFMNIFTLHGIFGKVMSCILWKSFASFLARHNKLRIFVWHAMNILIIFRVFKRHKHHRWCT